MSSFWGIEFTGSKLIVLLTHRLHGNVLSKDFTDIVLDHTIEQADDSLRTISEIYNDLFTFEKTLSTSLVGGHPRRNLRNQVENLSTEYPGSPSRKGLCTNRG